MSMPKRHRMLILALQLVGSVELPTVGLAQQLSPVVRATYSQVTSLRFSEATTGLQVMRRERVPEPVVLLLENQMDFLRAVIDDDKGSSRRFHRQAARRIEAAKSLPAATPWTRYAEAEMRLQRAVLWGKEGHYWACAQQVHQVCVLLEENWRTFPHFALNQKSLRLIMALIGTLPDEFRWAAELLSGVKGSVREGAEGLEALLSEPTPEVRLFEEEIRLALAFIKLTFLEDTEGARQVLQAPCWNAQHNPVAAYALAVVCLRAGRNDEAIRWLENCPEGEAYHPFWQRYHLLGSLKMNRLDADADQPLRHFMQYFTGETGRWDACRKVAWYHLLRGNEQGYRTWMERIRTAERPRTEQDLAAWREAREGPVPDPALLRARLLFDGGYYRRAYEELLRHPEAAYTGDNALEYVYRRARIAHALKYWEEAERYYRLTIEKGAQNPTYYACQSALQLGLMYEQTNRCVQAKQAYHTCLHLKPQLYRVSLHAKAKAGLARLQGKC
jgi:tetratricopeptide (TPR) repeat protein